MNIDNVIYFDKTVIENFIICTNIFKFFFKYWPDDGLFRPKL